MIKKIKNFFQRQPVSTCGHEWALVSKNYSPPHKEIPEGINATLAEKALMGVTSYLWICSLCGETKIVEVLGSDGNQLEEVLEKAEKLGVQYVEREKKVFAIARVPADDSRIPVK
jgi:hypothetical protein